MATGHVRSKSCETKEQYVAAAKAAIESFKANLAEMPANCAPTMVERDDTAWERGKVVRFDYSLYHGQIEGSALAENLEGVDGIVYIRHFPDDEKAVFVEIIRLHYGGIPTNVLTDDVYLNRWNYGTYTVVTVDGEILLVIDGKMQEKMAEGVSLTEAGTWE